MARPCSHTLPAQRQYCHSTCCLRIPPAAMGQYGSAPCNSSASPQARVPSGISEIPVQLQGSLATRAPQVLDTFPRIYIFCWETMILQDVMFHVYVCLEKGGWGRAAAFLQIGWGQIRQRPPKKYPCPTPTCAGPAYRPGVRAATGRSMGRRMGRWYLCMGRYRPCK